ncbi:hypothetical protein J6590_096096 [Homalodisca vitripennis]|nr:hypothetical protein J6590_096096 [Homalodisca vitripennis]
MGSLTDSLQFISDKMDQSNELIENVSRELVSLKNENEKLRAEHGEMSNSVIELQKKVRTLEQYTRRNNIEISSVPVTAREDVMSLGKALEVEVLDNHIEAAHIVPAYSSKREPSLVMQFQSRKLKDAWIRSSGERRSSRRHRLFAKCNGEYRAGGVMCFTREDVVATHIDINMITVDVIVLDISFNFHCGAANTQQYGGAGVIHPTEERRLAPPLFTSPLLFAKCNGEYRAGGVMCFTREDVVATHIDINMITVDVIVLDISFNLYCIYSFHRSPDGDFDELHLEEKSREENIFTNMLISHGLYISNRLPTRGTACLDSMATNFDSWDYKVEVIEPMIADHSAVIMTIKSSLGNAVSPKDRDEYYALYCKTNQYRLEVTEAKKAFNVHTIRSSSNM